MTADSVGALRAGATGPVFLSRFIIATSSPDMSAA
eukprot:CAMPEP_0114313490 /NCGR_PEP_ID=MMETSP0059-20121206/21155_1 /TAXON_ID=36894 /ORGANISM="Pyramimonas parkeae, Strain CCMP726" /LENGTH=34 /DNA_ID= /DNA_START= /DNA_END= /DNA_ORIENTATION=